MTVEKEVKWRRRLNWGGGGVDGGGEVGGWGWRRRRRGKDGGR